MSPLETLLDRLEKVKRAQGRRWTARCPAHFDKSPSLSISESAEGVVLVKCHAGCATEEVLAAVGLSFRDLFPEGSERSNSVRLPRPSRPDGAQLRAAFKVAQQGLKGRPGGFSPSQRTKPVRNYGGNR